MIQNKLHYAITGKTAAEIIYDRADRNKDFMGLSTWKNAPKGKILKRDVSIAKNYLSQPEIGDLSFLVSAFWDLAEFQARRNTVLLMKDWLERTNKFLDSNSLDIYQMLVKNHMKKQSKKHIKNMILLESNKTRITFLI